MRNLPRCLVALLAATSLSSAARADDNLPPPIGTIDFYGLGKIPRADVLARLPFKVGDQLPRSSPKRKGDAVARALGVARVEFAFICCSPERKVEAYVGIEPQGSKPLVWNATPTGSQQLPPELLAAYDAYGTELSAAVRSGNAMEDDSQGHSLSNYPPLRAQEEAFIAFARDHVDLLGDVLANAADGRQRGVAAHVLGYAPDKRVIVGPLTRAALDPDGLVRNNSTRALGVIAQFGLAHPELGIQVDPGPFIDMMNSVVWTDRNKGSFVLVSLSASRDPAVLGLLRHDALPALVDMCGWSNLGHAWSGCIILQRALGMGDEVNDQTRATAIARARRLF